MKTKQKVGLIVSTLIMIIAIVVMGPMDAFTHGFFYDELNYDLIATDLQESIHLEDGDYEMTFKPVKDHFAGFEINLINQPEGNEGNLVLTITNKNGNVVDKVLIDLSKVTAKSWYKVKLNKYLQKGKEYKLKISAINCNTIPYLQTIDPDYCTEETISGNLLITYAYADSTFTFQNKIIIALMIIAIWLFAIKYFVNNNGAKRICKYVSVVIFLTSLLSWNYMYNSMDNQNTTFDGFQADSEGLVTGVIIAEHNSIWYEDESKYGLGRYTDCLTDYTDGNWLNNYSRTECAVVVNANDYSREYAVIGNYIGFSNGEVIQITDVSDDGSSIVIHLNAGRVLNPYKYGDISDAVYCNSNKETIASLDTGKLNPYRSQYGLQGKVFRHLVRYMDYEEAIANFHLVCCISTAFVFSIIVLLILFKYNNILAGVFLYTFGLSPWIINFARNLYWVEFTWFIPMAVGLFCALKIDNRKCRVISYFATFIAIVGKCLCGYEYISVVMMGLISFLIVDWIKAIAVQEKQKKILIFRTILFLGIIALSGFMVAICIHAPLKGDGSLVEGIKNIFEQDVLRRTFGADMNEFNPILWPSFNASVWETYCKYFHFSTEVVTGIAGNLFPLLCITPLVILGYDLKMKKINIELLAFYVVFFLTSISWFCLAKGHSYLHTHMNYVLWYFGFVQTCIYIIVNKIIKAFKKVELKKKGRF